jgi:uncharacterized damage-inducible protein DinB
MDTEPRIDPPLQADERESLTAFLDYQRATMLRKVAGLSQDDLGRAAVPPSALTLAGLIKHLALVEDSWLQEVFLGRPLPEPWAGAPLDEDDDWDFHSAPDDEPADLTALYVAAMARSRAVVAAAESLDQLSVEASRREGTPFSLRWILLHLVEETARHAGHADLLREALDGQTGE